VTCGEIVDQVKSILRHIRALSPLPFLDDLLATAELYY